MDLRNRLNTVLEASWKMDSCGVELEGVFE